MPVTSRFSEERLGLWLAAAQGMNFIKLAFGFAPGVVSLIIIASTSSAQVRTLPSCAEVFSPPVATEPTWADRLQQKLPKKYRPAPALKPDERAIVAEAAEAFSGQSRRERAAWEQVARWIAQSINNPYTMIFDLHIAAEKNNSTARLELRSLFQILAQPKSSERTALLDEWTKSETHAVNLYAILQARGLAHYTDELGELARVNLFFSDAHLAKGQTLLTYAFEKEGRSSDVTMLYRPAATDEATWFKLSDVDRFAKIDGMQLRQKNFLPASVLAPTSLKPDYLSGYSVDGTTPNAVKSWEVTHKGFEISLHRLMGEVKQMSQLLKETHSLHLHTVFELPSQYAEFPRFRIWFKELNDALYLRGMEEGLHGNYLTGVANLPEDLKTKWFEEWTRKPQKFGVIRIEKASDVDSHNNKFFSAGLRAGIYGPASSTKAVKLGIELRDTTRNNALLEKTMTALSDALVSRRWETLPLNDVTRPTRLRTLRAETLLNLKAAGLRTSVAELMLKAEETIGIPFLKLETGPIFNFASRRYKFASTDYAAHATAARAKYVRGLFELQAELDGFAAKGESVEGEDIETAVRQLLTEWARAAKPSERFSF